MREYTRSYERDGGMWPSGVCLQGSAPNRSERHWLKTVVVSVRVKGLSLRWVRCGSRRRIQVNHHSGVENKLIDIKTGFLGCTRDEPDRNLLTGLAVFGVEVA